MERRIVDLANDHWQLRKQRGCLLAQQADRKVQIPFDEIEAILVHAHQVSYSNNLFIELAAQKIPVILCNHAHMPISWVWPIEGNYQQAKVMRAQTELTKARKNQLWAQLIKQKIKNQADLLFKQGQPHNALLEMQRRVRSGDPENLEAQAAKRYWRLLFGANFRRDQNADGLNSMLNYGYIILRSAIARYIVASGLHPSLGLYHSNQFNGFCLADDLIEPFRPFIDAQICQLLEEGETDLSETVKQALVSSLSTETEFEDGFVPLSRAIERFVQSFSTKIMDNKVKLQLPKIGTCLW